MSSARFARSLVLWIATAIPTFAAAPVLTSLSVDKVNTELPFVLTVTGSHFLPHAMVAFGDGTVVTITAQTATTITITGASQTAAGGVVKVRVINPASSSKSPSQASNAKNLTVLPPVSLSVSPSAKTLRAGSTQIFDPHLEHAVVKTVTWTLSAIDPVTNEPASAPDLVGSIDTHGKYTAPSLVGVPSVTLTATSAADPSKSSSAVVTLQNAVPLITSVTTPVTAGNVTLTITGTGFAPGATLIGGGTTWTVTWTGATLLTATGTVGPPVGGLIGVRVVNPAPGPAHSNPFAVRVDNSGSMLTLNDARRFLEQATWGPTPQDIAHLQNIGIPAWLAEQFNLPPSQYYLPVDETSGLTTLQEQFFKHAVSGPDQLRQRVAFALSQIVVVSGSKLPRYYQMQPFQQILLNDAFGGYGQLLKDVTLSPSMGHYLDMVNNSKPTATTSPDENYSREVMQLFSIGLNQLNADSSPVMAGSPAAPVVTYTQQDVEQLARVFTGWTYPACYDTSKWTNPPCFTSNMVASESHHDQTAKTVLGSAIPGGGTAETDLDQALSIIESYPNAAAPNIAPFVALRLIQHLVTSNPSPAYVAAVASQYGNLQAMVTETLTNPEARTDPNAAPFPLGVPDNRGHLKEPVLFAAALLRALDAECLYDPPLNPSTSSMGQNLFNAPSVFNYYSPFYRVPASAAVGPEFQILSQGTALARAGFVYRALRNQISPNIVIKTGAWNDLASDSNPDTQTASLTALLDSMSEALLGGPMANDMLNAILPSLLATKDAPTRVQNALFLVATSSRYQVER